jgi:CheY-like chemotaxis protein
MIDNNELMAKALAQRYLTDKDFGNKSLVQDNASIKDKVECDVALTPNVHNETSVIPAFLSMPAFDAPPLILLAEDNEFTAETMRDYLLFHGFRVNHARDGYEVIEQALEAKPDLIIMDIQMPGLNGFEATQRLRTEALTAETPIIALTALAMSGDRERCLNAGANAYFSKPLSLRQLLDTINLFLTKA